MTNFLFFKNIQAPFNFLAVVIMETPNHIYKKRVGSAGEIQSQSLLNVVHFGLGQEKGINKITVRWQNGEEEILENIEVNRLHDILKK